MIPLELITRCHGTLLLLKREAGSEDKCFRHTPTWRGLWAMHLLTITTVYLELKRSGHALTGAYKSRDVAIAGYLSKWNFLDGRIDGIEKCLCFV